MVVAPTGFISDHLEVLWDLDNEAAETAAALGLDYARAGTAGTHPAFVNSLVDLVAEKVEASNRSRWGPRHLRLGMPGRLLSSSGSATGLSS